MLPTLKAPSTTQDMINKFGGYNHNYVLNENEFYDTKNLTSEYYPVISPRKKRGKIKQFTKPNGLIAADRLGWVDGTAFYYNNQEIGAVEDSEKQLVKMGAYILIFPDKKYYNTFTNEFGSLETSFEAETTVTFTLTQLDGTEYEDVTVSPIAPEGPTDGMLWMDTSVTPNSLKQYSASFEMWTTIPTTYVKISCTGIGSNFKIFDGVTISECTNSDFNSDFILYGVGDDYIVVTGMISSSFSQIGLKVERKVPDMEYYTECDNRVWGCNSDNHEIYACKLGDPFNWNCYMGISTDSYAVTVGTSGIFTGACTHLGYVLFFKENYIHKIQGSKPSNFQVSVLNVRGVQSDSERSINTVNETLYFKSEDSVCAYSGSLPSPISEKLGDIQYSDAVSGQLGSKYYISMKDTYGNWNLFIYDDYYNIWLKEDHTQFLYTATLDNELYYIASDNCLYSINGRLGLYDGDSDYNGSESESPVEWFAETGDWTLSLPNKKYIRSLQIRFELDAAMRLLIQYDSDGEWHAVKMFSVGSKKSINISVTPRRCDHFKLKFLGTDNCKIYSITKVIEQGSEF